MNHARDPPLPAESDTSRALAMYDMFTWIVQTTVERQFSRYTPMALPCIGFFVHHQTRTTKKEFRERQRRERRKFGDICEEFSPHRSKNDAYFLSVLKISKFCLPPLHKTGIKMGGGGRTPTFSFASQVVGTRPKTTTPEKWGAMKPCRDCTICTVWSFSLTRLYTCQEKATESGKPCSR